MRFRRRFSRRFRQGFAALGGGAPPAPPDLNVLNTAGTNFGCPFQVIDKDGNSFTVTADVRDKDDNNFVVI